MPGRFMPSNFDLMTGIREFQWNDSSATFRGYTNESNHWKSLETNRDTWKYHAFFRLTSIWNHKPGFIIPVL